MFDRQTRISQVQQRAVDFLGAFGKARCSHLTTFRFLKSFKQRPLHNMHRLLLACSDAVRRSWRSPQQPVRRKLMLVDVCSKAVMNLIVAMAS